MKHLSVNVTSDYIRVVSLIKKIIDYKILFFLKLTQQWLEVQKLRSKLKKRKIDTKASKGKKVNYESN